MPAGQYSMAVGTPGIALQTFKKIWFIKRQMFTAAANGF